MPTSRFCATLALAISSALAACGAARTPPPAAAVPAPASASPPADPCATVAAFRAARADTPADPVAAARAYLAACAGSQIEALTRDLVRFPTTAGEHPTGKSPAFAGMARALEAWAQQRGLRFTVAGDGDAWEIGFGEGDRLLGFVMHGDVVPAVGSHGADTAEAGASSAVPAGWTHPPFEVTRDGGRLIGRGVEDDKGPLATVLVMLAALREAGFAPGGRVYAIVGLGEESDWDPMLRYAGTQPLPRDTISVDGAFPVIVGEDGFVAWQLAVPRTPSARPQRAVATAVDGGEFLTQVPGLATMRLSPAPGEGVADLARRVGAAIDAELPKRGAGFALAATVDGAQVVVRATGVAVHSSTPEQGKNALWPLASLARRLRLERNGPAAMLELVAQRFDGDDYGQKLGLAYSHPVMGKLVAAPTVLRTEEGQVSLAVNMRRPAGVTSAEFSSRLDATLKRLQREVEPKLVEVGDRYVGEAHLVPDTGRLVTTLLGVYREATGDAAASAITIRGGTYARLFPGGVSFGPVAAGAASTAHAPDEWVEQGELVRLSAMLLEATTRLVGPGAAQVTGKAP